MRIAEECEEDNRMRCLQHPLVYNSEIEVEHARVEWSYHIHGNSYDVQETSFVVIILC